MREAKALGDINIPTPGWGDGGFPEASHTSLRGLSGGLSAPTSSSLSRVSGFDLHNSNIKPLASRSWQEDQARSLGLGFIMSEKPTLGRRRASGDPLNSEAGAAW